MITSINLSSKETFHSFKYICVKKNLKMGATIELMIEKFVEENKDD